MARLQAYSERSLLRASSGSYTRECENFCSRCQRSAANSCIFEPRMDMSAVDDVRIRCIPGWGISVESTWKISTVIPTEICISTLNEGLRVHMRSPVRLCHRTSFHECIRGRSCKLGLRRRGRGRIQKRIGEGGVSCAVGQQWIRT